MLFKPNFIIVGAAKSGTTSLYGYLKQHQEIFLPDIKECRYFSTIKEKDKNPFTGTKHDVKIIKHSDEYYSLFKAAKAYTVSGDVSPDYLYYYKTSAERIKRELGEQTKIIIILRNPVDRAYSNYLHLIRHNLTNVSFDKVINLEKDWVNKDVWYGFLVINAGYYHDSVNYYLRSFKNTKILIFEEFIEHEDAYLKELCDFLNIDKQFHFKKPYFTNKTGTPKNRLLHKFLSGDVPFKKAVKKLLSKFNFANKNKIKQKVIILKEKNLVKPNLPDRLRIDLYEKYKQDIQKLEGLLNIDLSSWKPNKPQKI
jgi:sulfotransferase family protein